MPHVQYEVQIVLVCIRYKQSARKGCSLSDSNLSSNDLIAIGCALIAGKLNGKLIKKKKFIACVQFRP